MVVLEKLTEEVKALQDRANRVTEQNDALRATIMDKDLSLEGALNDADKFKAQVAAKDEQVRGGTLCLLRIEWCCEAFRQPCILEVAMGNI